MNFQKTKTTSNTDVSKWNPNATYGPHKSTHSHKSGLEHQTPTSEPVSDMVPGVQNLYRGNDVSQTAEAVVRLETG